VTGQGEQQAFIHRADGSHVELLVSGAASDLAGADSPTDTWVLVPPDDYHVHEGDQLVHNLTGRPVFLATPIAQVLAGIRPACDQPHEHV
jgi:hypothetical protein